MSPDKEERDGSEIMMSVQFIYRILSVLNRALVAVTN